MGKEKNTIVTSVYLDAVKMRGLNRVITIVKMDPPEDVPFAAKNVIFLKSLTAESGVKPGVRHELSKNKKVKISSMGLTDDAVLELYVGLSHYIEKFINNQTK